LSESVVHERHGDCLLITLNRPDRLNSFTVDMHESLSSILSVADEDETLTSVILTGAGRAFCAGQDLQESSNPNGPIKDLGEHLTKYYNPLIRKIGGMKLPVITAVNGAAAGAGASLALSGDIVLAARSAKFVQAFTRIGLVPDSGATWMLPRLVGPQRAAAMLLLNEDIDAEKALRWGLVWSIEDDDHLLDAAFAIAGRLSAQPRSGLALTKQALQQARDNSLSEQLEVESRLQSIAGATPEYREAVESFFTVRAKPSRHLA